MTTVTVLPHRTHSRGTLGAVGQRATWIAGIAGTVWTLAGTVVLTLSYADAAGTDPFREGLAAESVTYFIANIGLGRSLAISVLLAGIATTCCFAATRITTIGVCTLIALGALLPLTVTSHGASNHEDAVNLLALHLIGATIWAGGLLSVFALRAPLDGDFPHVVRRYSRLAGWCFALVLLSGVGGAILRIGSFSALASAYGIILILKTAALVLLGVAGWVHRTRTISTLEREPGRRSPFLRLAGVELAVMAVAVGLAVGLGRTSPFATLAVSNAAESLLGYPLPPPLGAAEWITQWHLDVVWTPVAVLLAGGYLIAVSRWNRRNDMWSRLRTGSWLLGCLALTWATSSAPAVYGRILPVMHVIEETTLGLIVPVLLISGAPGVLAGATLPRRADGSRGLREWVALLLHSRAAHLLHRPAPALSLYVALLLGYYFTPVLQLSLSNNSFRLAAMTAALLVGLNLVGAIRASPEPTRAWILAGALAAHIGAGLSVMGGGLQADDWYAYIQALWSYAGADQGIAAGAALWVVGLIGLFTLSITIMRPNTEDGRLALERPVPAERDHDGVRAHPAKPR
ncbi:cytochrome c oxidase assembly protein [Microbacterium maritypicum]